MKIFGQFAYAAASLVVVCALSFPVAAQKGGKGAPPPPKPAASPQNIPAPQNNRGNEGKNNRVQPNNANKNAGANLREAAKLPPKFVENLEDMSTEQRERFMQNNERFKNMNPQEQARIKEHLQEWNNMSPQQRIQYRAQEQALEQMKPVERQYVRQQLLPQLRAMAPAQRQFLRQHVRELEGLSDADRETKMHDPTFLQGLSPEEQQMIPYLSRLHWAGVVEAPTPPGN
jgi:hypothetical protein